MSLAPRADIQPDKTMLRVYDSEQKGATAFFRNRALLQTVDELLKSMSRRQSRLRVLFHASSIGAEVYSFVIHSRLSGLADCCQLEVSATDLNARFLEHARSVATYPAQSLDKMTPAERAFFSSAGEGEIRPLEEIRQSVRFLPPCSFVDATFDDVFDAVFIQNALTYVTPEQQRQCLDHVARYNQSLFIACAFHPDTIEADLSRHGYLPVLTRIADIHNGWSERIWTSDLPAPGTPEYSWVIPPFAEVPGYEFRFCSIFQRRTPLAPREDDHRPE